MDKVITPARGSHPAALHAFLTLAMALPMLVFYAVGALSPFLLPDLGIPPSWLGYLTSATFGLAAILSLWAGPLVRNIGSRRALQLLFGTAALAFTLMALLPGFVGLLIAVAVCGIGQALANPATNLLIMQRIEGPKKPFAVGLKQSGVQLAAIAAGALLPPLAAALGWRAALAVAVLPALVLAATAARFAPPPPAERLPIRLARPNQLVGALMGVQLCVGAALSAFVTYLALFATQQGVPATVAGAMVALFGATGIASRLVLTPLAARVREEACIVVLALLAGASVIVGAQASAAQTWPLWVAAFGMGATAVAINAIGMSLVLRDTSFGPPAEVSGFLAAAFFAGIAGGPLLFGAVLLPLDWRGAWLGVACVLAIGAVLAWRLARLRPSNPPAGAAAKA